MKHISIIAAIDEGFGLGKNNQLLCHLPADLKHFKQLTLNKTIIMGSNTFYSIGKPLPKRVNVVLSHKSKDYPGVYWVNTLEAALAYNTSNEEIMVIGGESLYRQTLPLANKLYLTQIHHLFEADRFFPELDRKEWQIASSLFRPKDANNPYDMTFLELKRKAR